MNDISKYTDKTRYTDKSNWTKEDYEFFERFEAFMRSLGMNPTSSDDPNFDWDRHHEAMMDYYLEDDTPYEFVFDEEITEEQLME